MKNFEIAIRNFKKNRTTTAIIIISLSLGFACLNLIATFLVRELRTDNFQVDKDRIYSLVIDDPFNAGNKSYVFHNDAADYIKNTFEQVEDVCTYHGFMVSNLSVGNNKHVDVLEGIETSSNFFNFFTYPLLIGNPKSVLESNSDIVISDQLAQKLFGSEPPLGKTIEIERSAKKFSYNITGVFKKPTQNSQLDFDLVTKFESKNTYPKAYLKLTNGSNATELQNLLSEFKSEIPVLGGEVKNQYSLKSLKETYFDPTRPSEIVGERSQSKTTIWVVAIVGILIFALAMFNFLGILNSNIMDRAKNYSIYQINGAKKIHLIKSVFSEVVLLLIPSFFASLVLLKWILPVFKNLINASISYNYTFHFINITILIFLLILSLFLALLFVVYKLNAITGSRAIRGDKTNHKFQIPALNVFQLAVTILLIVSSLIIIKQIQFINNRDIGVNKQVIDLSVNRDMAKKLGILKNKLLQYPSISNASITSNSVLRPIKVILSYEKNGEESNFLTTQFTADENYVETIGLNIVQGQNFSNDQIQNRWKCLINESMAKRLKIEDLTDARLPAYDMQIIGIVKDFNYESLRSNVYPAIIDWDGEAYHLLEQGRNVLIKTADNAGENALDDIKTAWEEVYPDTPFEFTTVGQQYEILHAENKKTIQLVVICCVVSILLSMMGLFAVVLQNAKLRTKEIGIRKVSGARISEVMFLLNQDFIKWTIVAFIISTPLAFYAMHKWLENFAYKTELGWWIFALAGLLALGIALLTVSWQSWRAATRNPVESLRYE